MCANSTLSLRAISPFNTIRVMGKRYKLPTKEGNPVLRSHRQPH